MSHKTLFIQRGRADPHPLVTVDDDSPNQNEVIAAVKQKALQDAISEGRNPASVKFSVEHVIDSDTPQTTKKGKK